MCLFPAGVIASMAVMIVETAGGVVEITHISLGLVVMIVVMIEMATTAVGLVGTMKIDAQTDKETEAGAAAEAAAEAGLGNEGADGSCNSTS